MDYEVLSVGLKRCFYIPPSKKLVVVESTVAVVPLPVALA